MDASAVRPATPADVPRLAGVLARAYQDDPLMRWFVPDDRGRARRLERFFAATLRRMIGRSLREALTTEDLAGIAMWAAPGTCKVPVPAMLPGLPAMVAALRAGMLRSARAYGALLARHDPGHAHWYLETIATDPDRQGHGVATALMAPVLERCDASGVPAYLETQKDGNVGFYERRGFAVVGELDIPGGGPHMWLMSRRTA